MKKKVFFLLLIVLAISINKVFAQNQLSDLSSFRDPAGNWVMADNVEMDSINPEILVFEQGSGCLVNAVDGKAKYLVTKSEYEDLELHIEFMLPKGSNSGIYFQCRYEIQLFDSWGVNDLTYYDCGGIQQGMYSSKQVRLYQFRKYIYND